MEDSSWITPIIDYLQNNTLPADRNEARRVKAKAACFSIIQGKLYKRSFSGPYLRCVNPAEAKYVLVKLHEGECGNHSGARSLANKAITTGYYWQTMREDSRSHVGRCDKCQRHAQVPRQPPENLTPIPSPMALHEMGNGYRGQATSNTRTTSLYVSGHGLLH